MPKRIKGTLDALDTVTDGAEWLARRGIRTVKTSLMWGGRRRTEPGAAPGTIVIDPEAPKPEIDYVAYGPDYFEERSDVSVEEVAAIRESAPLLWVNIEGTGDAKVLNELGELFNIHPLVMEDVVSLHQRAKAERYGEHQFIVARMAMIEETLKTEQVSMFFGHGFLLTFQEGIAGDCFEPVRKRIRLGADALRNTQSDYLAYALLDSVIDAYFPVLETLGESFELLEEDVLVAPSPHQMALIHGMKRDLLSLRRAVWPQREAINSLIRDQNELISQETRTYLMDAYDHTIQIIDLLETYRELASGLVDLYLSSVSNRMNEVMKVLTIIATIFIPLTFIAGIYGMNFNTQTSKWNMPELNWTFGYPLTMAIMVGIAGLLVAYFWRKGWLGSDGISIEERRARAALADRRSQSEDPGPNGTKIGA